MTKIPVGVSECLLGAPVRFDGGHKHDRYLTEVLGQFWDFRPACPELAIGLGVPRKPIRIIATDSGDRVRGRADPALDVTAALAEQADQMAAAMPELCGYIFMQKSPSCGVFSMKRYHPDGEYRDSAGRGAYAAQLMRRMPLLPVEEAGRLRDPDLRDNFITRVFAYHDWQQSVATAPSAAKLIKFYSRYKYQVMAHQVASYKAIGRLLANLSEHDIQDVCDRFIRLFMDALSQPATRRGNTNAMNHLRGYLRDLQGWEKEELSRRIEEYHSGQVPLVVPLTLLKRHLAKTDDPYLEHQTFWAPHPEKLGLRNVVNKF